MELFKEPIVWIALAFSLFTAGVIVGRRPSTGRRFLGPADVEVERIGVTSGGRMIVVHYRVKKPGRLLREGQFGLDDGPNGKRSSQDPLGAWRQRADGRGPRHATVPNVGSIVRPGSTVTVRFGRRVWEHLVVR